NDVLAPGASGIPKKGTGRASGTLAPVAHSRWAASKESYMKTSWVVLSFLSLFVGSVARGQEKAGHADDSDHVVVRPDAIKWGHAPPGLPPGSQMAALLGDPSKSGVPYVIRAKLPDGYKVPPHWHPSDENVTVLKGALLIGKGEKFDASKME